MPPPEEFGKLLEGCGALVLEHGGALGVWRGHSLPRVKAACDRIRAAPTDVPLRVLAEEEDYAQHHTMVSSMITWNDMNLVEAVCASLYGDQAALVAFELSQGYENATLRADQRVWELAQLAQGDPGVDEALDATDGRAAMAELRERGGHESFFTALDDFLDVYGSRGETWSIDDPTWSEQGPGLWAQLRHLGRADVPSPEEQLQRGAARRASLIAEIEGRLADVVDQQSRFRRRVERLSDYVPVREERAEWQLIAVGVLRHALLRRGDELAASGAIGQADDVLYLLPVELDERSLPSRDVIAERRADRERWRAARPPLVIGSATVADLPDTSVRVLTGVPASRGVARGRACVVHDLADAARLEPGDILVCPMTAPPWTPLFAIAAAIVTDCGELGSHPAIAAREYGLPCVVGTRSATQAIADGDEVVVDGSAGTVEIIGDAPH
jgi:pyruvate,water dikinase